MSATPSSLSTPNEMSNIQKQWITFKVSPQEMIAIEAYCLQTQRTKTDVLRELIRKLPSYDNATDDIYASSIDSLGI